MMSDIRGFTQLSEQQEPTTILTWLNEYFGALVPLITAENGVVDKFEGDAILAFFGILPQPLSPMESAYNACKAAIKLLTEINRINHCREERGEPALVTGIAINTGLVTAGGLGTTDRLNYTIIGDPVNTVQRMQDVTRGFGESGIVISQPTLDYLKDHWNEFRFENLGQHSFKGKSETVSIYRVMHVLENEGSEI